MAGAAAARATLTCIRMSVVTFSVACMVVVVNNRVQKYEAMKVVQRRSTSRTLGDPPWFELALCFGPKIPPEVMHDYFKETRKAAADRYRSYVDPSHSGVEFNATMAVNSVGSYREFFGADGRYNWKDDVFWLASRAAAVLRPLLDSIHHRVRIGGSEIPNALTYTDMPFLFHYALCRNYSYKLAGGKRSVGQFSHQVYVNDSVQDAVFRAAWYVDLYVYRRGHFSEFPLVVDHMPYRSDLHAHDLLNVAGEKTERMFRSNIWECTTDSSHNYVNCMSWCLMSGLLAKVDCIMPMLIPYIFNMTGRMPTEVVTPAVAPPKVPWMNLYPPEAAWPWMTEFAHMKLCTSASAFSKMFKTFSRVFYPRTKEKFPETPHCAKECPHDCSEYHVAIIAAGTMLVPDDHSAQHATEHETVHSVTLLHSPLVVVKERRIYTTEQLLIDISGALSFLLGLSILAIHNWVFSLTKWVLTRVGYVEGEEDEDWGDEEGAIWPIEEVPEESDGAAPEETDRTLGRSRTGDRKDGPRLRVNTQGESSGPGRFY